MTRTSPERFVQEQIGAVVAQIRQPVTNRPRVEVEALVAELVYWNEQARRLEAVKDWEPVL